MAFIDQLGKVIFCTIEFRVPSSAETAIDYVYWVLIKIAIVLRKVLDTLISYTAGEMRNYNDRIH